MKTSLGVLTGYYETLVENTSGCPILVRTLVFSNVEQGAVSVDLKMSRGDASYQIVSGSPVPPGKSLVAFVSKDWYVTLEPGDRLEGRCDPASGMHFLCSYEWPEPCSSSSSSSQNVIQDCACWRWNCETSGCDIVLVGCPDPSDPCYDANNCCSYIGLLDECVYDGSCPSSSSSNSICSCSKEWDPGNCVPIMVDASRLVYVDDGNLPDPCAPSGLVTIYIPKQLTMALTTPCFGTIQTSYRYREGSTNQWTRIYNPPAEWQAEYDASPTSDYLLFDPSLTTTSLQGFRVYYHDILPEDNWETDNWPNTVVDGYARFKVRYRREYGDYTFVGAEGTSFTRQSCSGCVCSEVPARTPTWSGPSTPNSDLYNSFGSSGFYLGSCSDSNELLNNITVEITGVETCRQPLPTADCTTCINSPSVDYTTLPSHPDYFAGCTGRPIDIDFDSCNATIRPTSFGKSNFVLYYQGGPDQPFMVIDNVAYDPRGAGLIKVFTTSDPESMREMVCSRLRFATLVDETKLSTDIGSALDSNWPYNDLYWYSACGNLPGEVPINLVPC